MNKIKDWRGILFIVACAAAMFFAKSAYDYLAPAEPPPEQISSDDFRHALSKPEPQGFSAPQRLIAKEKLLPILKTGVKPSTLWSLCKGKSCVPELKDVITLTEKAQNPETFVNQVCMVAVAEPRRKHWLIQPVYIYNAEKNICELKNQKEVGLVTTRQTLVAVILASAVIFGVALMGWGLFTITKEDQDGE